MNSNPSILAIDVGFGNVKWHGTRPGDNKRTDAAAFPARAIAAARPLEMANYGRRHDIHQVFVDDRRYYVGKDVELLLRHTTFAPLERDYPLTAPYKALVLGAMAESKLREIDLLVLGLPGRVFKDESMRAAMRERYAGLHQLSDWTVRVGEVLVVAQPVGGLASFAEHKQIWHKMRSENALIVDPGYNTLDWCNYRAGKVLPQFTSSEQGGMAVFLQAMRDELELKHPQLSIKGTHTIDEALRGVTHLKHEGVRIDIKPIIKAAMYVWENSLNNMIHSVGPLSDFDAVYVVGGGATWIADAIRERYPKLDVHVTPAEQPMMANVAGFFFGGMQYWNQRAVSDSERTDRTRLAQAA